MSTRLPDLLQQHRTVLVVTAVMLLVILAFARATADMIDMWGVSVYRHCWIIAPLALFLMSHQSRALEAQPFSINWLAMLILPVFALTIFVAERASIRALEHSALVATVMTAILAVIGWRKFRQILFPVALLAAAVPVGDFLIPTLMDWTADIAAALLELTGVPAFRQGAIITLPNGVFHVAEVCSGISYVLASLILSLMYAYLTFVSIRRRIAFVVLTVITFIVLNGIRAFLVMIVANATEMRWFTGWDHVYFGQFLFICLTVCLYLIGQRFSDRPTEASGDASAVRLPWSVKPILRRAAAVALLTFGVSRSASALLVVDPSIVVEPKQQLVVTDCELIGNWDDAFEPKLSGAMSATSKSFDCDDVVVNFIVAQFDDPANGSEVVNRQHVYWPEAWASRGTSATHALQHAQESMTLGELSLDLPSGFRLVWYAYAIGSVTTSNRYLAKFWEAVYSVSGKRHIAELYLVTTRYPGEGPAARQFLEQHIDVTARDAS
ncbi:MAG: exosortase A [Pseudomonadota bacterium]